MKSIRGVSAEIALYKDAPSYGSYPGSTTFQISFQMFFNRFKSKLVSVTEFSFMLGTSLQCMQATRVIFSLTVLAGSGSSSESDEASCSRMAPWLRLTIRTLLSNIWEGDFLNGSDLCSVTSTSMSASLRMQIDNMQ